MPEQIDVNIADFASTDKGAGYKTKLQQMLDKLRYAIQQYNAQLQSGADAAAQLTAIQQIREHIDQVEQNVGVISQGDLPVQGGKAKRAFVTNGVTAAWQHVIGANRQESDNFTAVAGDRALATITAAKTAMLPATLTTDDPFLLCNCLLSSHDLAIAVPSGAPYSLIWSGELTLAAGESKALPPGGWVELHAVSPTQLVVIRPSMEALENADLAFILSL